MPEHHGTTGVEVLATRIDSLIREVDRRFDSVEGGIERIERELMGEYVTRKEFQPVMWIAYGMVGFITLGVLAALMAIIIRGNPS